jgi:glycosyltransferase involved in cell wall biosynthesis
MRVGILVYGLDRPLTGIGRYTVEYVRALAALPDAPDIMLLTAGASGPLADLGLPEIMLRGCRLLPGLLTLGNLLMPSLAEKYQLDVLHDTSGVAPFLSGAGQARIVLTLYDVIPWSAPGYSTRLDTLIHRRWLPWTVNRADAILTLSEASRGDIYRYLGVPPDRITVLRGGVDPLYQPAEPDAIQFARSRYNLGKHYLLYVGSIEERKNLRRVLEAFARLRGEGYPHQLAIVGPQKWKYGAILGAIQQHRLEEVVIFTGYVPQSDLPALYSGADVFVFPSLYEGLGLPVLEAMACGTAVVTSNVSSLPEVAGDAALTVNPTQTEAIVAAIRALLDDPILRDDLARRGRLRAAQFTWAEVARRGLGVYHQFVEAR